MQLCHFELQQDKTEVAIWFDWKKNKNKNWERKRNSNSIKQVYKIDEVSYLETAEIVK